MDALHAHAHLDRIAGSDQLWARRAADLYAALVPDGLDPDPLAVVEAEMGRRDEQSRTLRRPRRRS